MHFDNYFQYLTAVLMARVLIVFVDGYQHENIILYIILLFFTFFFFLGEISYTATLVNPS